jgi:putative alpha-1,2-mannosidase
LTATARAGFHRYTFPATAEGHVVVDLQHGIGNKVTEAQLAIEDDRTASGYRRSDGWGGGKTSYFVMAFSRPFDAAGVAQADKDTQRVSKVLEYAYDDACIARMASALGKVDLAETHGRRSQNWTNVFDPSTGFMRGKNNSDKNLFIQSATLDGQPMTRSWISREEIARGGKLVLTMGPTPNKHFGSAPADRPPGH